MTFSPPGEDHPDPTPAAGGGHSEPGQLYPLPRPEDDVDGLSGTDRRFNAGLIIDVGRVLAEHGFPAITSGTDNVRLSQALFVFIYGTSSERGQTGGGEGR